MARPKLDPKQSRTQVLPPLRVSQSEKDCIRAKAKEAGLTLSAFQRQACLYPKIEVKEASFKVNVMAFTELNKIGHNFNQFIKLEHVQGQFDKERFDHLMAAMDTVIMKIIEAG